jgi:polyisoprenoid-binding protein YceI
LGSAQVIGDLTITDVTKTVTFDATVTPVSETRIEGAAATTVNYRDFGLFIPDAPVFDTVADEVRLELKFVAEADRSSVPQGNTCYNDQSATCWK